MSSGVRTLPSGDLRHELKQGSEYCDQPAAVTQGWGGYRPPTLSRLGGFAAQRVSDHAWPNRPWIGSYFREISETLPPNLAMLGVPAISVMIVWLSNSACNQT